MLFLLAKDAVEDKIDFNREIIQQPKIDGVRGGHLIDNLGFTGRSLKHFGNRYATEYFSDPRFFGFDGEMAAEHETNDALCRLTTSALTTHKGEPWLLWHVFDFLTPSTIHLGYKQRLMMMDRMVESIQKDFPELGSHLRPIQRRYPKTLTEFLRNHDEWSAAGYEGSCMRYADAPHKSGRSTVKEGYLLRVKEYDFKRMRVIRVEEGQTNLNEATIDRRGFTERSTHQENMVPNGMVGTLICEDLLEPGTLHNVSPGKATHDQRKAWLRNPSLIVMKGIIVKHFLKGVKDKDRHATFQYIDE